MGLRLEQSQLWTACGRSGFTIDRENISAQPHRHLATHAVRCEISEGLGRKPPRWDNRHRKLNPVSGEIAASGLTRGGVFSDLWFVRVLTSFDLRSLIPSGRSSIGAGESAATALSAVRLQTGSPVRAGELIRVCHNAVAVGSKIHIETPVPISAARADCTGQVQFSCENVGKTLNLTARQESYR